jgi:uncharacterized membrane protein YgcG
VSGASPTLALVLAKLGRTDGRSLLKQAVKELIARDALRVETEERPRRDRGRRTRYWLVEGPASAPPSRALQITLRRVMDVKAVVRNGRPARELPAVAKALSRGGARGAILDAALQDLIAMGLVREEERRTLGLFRRVVAVRTPGGDALVENERRRRARPVGAADAVYVPVGDSGAPQHDPEYDERFDPAQHGVLDGSFDGAFDHSFDSAFDSSFDAAFDSGFSDGGGGGGDGGGGGGGDGGGGGGGD